VPSIAAWLTQPPCRSLYIYHHTCTHPQYTHIYLHQESSFYQAFVCLSVCLSVTSCKRIFMKILRQTNLLTKGRTDYILEVTSLWIQSGNTWEILQHYETGQFSTIWLTALEKNWSNDENILSSMYLCTRRSSLNVESQSPDPDSWVQIGFALVKVCALPVL